MYRAGALVALGASAARIRAASNLAMPDAIVVATALCARADVLVTNDRGWPASLAVLVGGLRILQLGDVIR